MINEPLMPDFVAGLEQRLRAAAATPTPSPVPLPSARRRVTPWRALTVAGVACVAAGAIMIATDSGDHATQPVANGPTAHATPTATRSPDRTARRDEGKPEILSVAPVKVSEATIGKGIAMRMFLGPDADISTARPFPAWGGTAYVIGNDKGWCLSAPMPGADDPVARGFTCQKSAQFLRYGISLRSGTHYVAVLPPGVKAPALENPDGTVRSLEPSDIGVVTVDDLQDGSVITTYGPDGTPPRRDKITFP